MRILTKQLKNLLIICLVAVFLIFLAIVPKDPFSFTMKFNFDDMYNLYKSTIMNLLSGKGLGKAESGAYIFDEVIRFSIRSIKLILPSFFLSFTLGVLLGIFAFINRENRLGRFIEGLNLLFSSLPDFFVFILIQYGLLLVIRLGFPHLDLFGHEHWYNTLLPILCLSLYPILYMYRITSANLESEEPKDYVTTARAKGKSDTYIIFTHLLWNTWSSILTNLRTIMLYILTSLPIIELLAYYRGMGYYLLKAIQNDQIMLTVGYLLPFLLIMYITMFVSDIAKDLLIPFSGETQQAVRPVRVSKLRNIILSTLTYLWNAVLFVKQFPLLVLSGLFLTLILFFSFIGPSLSIVDSELKPFLFIKDEHGKMIVPPLPPSSDYWFGTNRKGVDLFSLIVLGAKDTLLIVCLISIVRFLFAIPLGYFASRNKKFFQMLLRGLQFIFSYFPIIFIVMLYMAIPYFEFTPNRIYWMVSLLALVEIGRIAQIYKEEFERISSQEFVIAGTSVGTSKWSLFANYYFPYLKKKSIIYFTTDLGRSMFLLAQFGFVSVFLQQEYVQNESGQWYFENRSLVWPVWLSNSLNDIREAIWIPFFASACIAFTIVTFSFLGEGLKKYYNKKRIKVEKNLIEEKWNRMVQTIDSFNLSPKKILINASILVVICISAFYFLSSKGYLGDKLSTASKMAEANNRMVNNVEVFSKVFGYVRYFHPSDQVRVLDWDKFAIYGVQQVKDAKDDKELRHKLEQLFYPIAPTMSFYEEGEQPENPFASIGNINNKATLKLAAWQHQGQGKVYPAGVGKPRTNELDNDLFKSQIVYTDVNKKEPIKGVFDLFPEKEQLIREKVDQNLYLQLPLVLYYTEQDGTIGASKESDQLFMETFGDLKELDLNELDLKNADVRLADIVIAWNKIQHFYPNFIGARNEWKNELRPALEGALSAKNEMAFKQTLQKMLIPLQDGQANVDIGLESRIKYNLPFHIEIVNGSLIVSSSEPSSPIQRGDIILEKDGKDALEELKKLAQLNSGSTQWKIYKALNDFIIGEKGTRVKLKINRNGEEKEILMTFDIVYEVDEFNRTDIVKELKQDIYYVNLNRTKMDDIRPHLDKLLNAKGVIFDLRGTPDLSTRELLSYMVDQPATGSQFKIPQIVVPNFQKVADYNRSIQDEWNINPLSPKFSGKLVFLAYKGTMGDAESYLNFVKENNLGDIVGMISAGSNGLVNTSTLPGDVHFSWTGMEVTKDDGSVLNAIGIQPTVETQQTFEGIKSGKDEYLEKALSLFAEE